MPGLIHFSRAFIYMLFISLFVSACGKKIEVVENVTEEGNTERYSRLVKDYAKEGLYTLTNPQGVKLEEAYFTNDTLNGKRMLFYESGDTLLVENYTMGKFEGPFREYFSNGHLKAEGNYIENAMKGNWKSYYDNGQLKEVVAFEKNEENGPFIEYYKNGNLKAEGSYLNGDYEEGPLNLYNEAGELTRKMECKQGICRTIWLSESVLTDAEE